MSNKKIKEKNKFQESWLSKEEYIAWLEEDSIEYAAKCKLCRKEIYLDNMSESALKSHMPAVKHS